MIRTAVEIEEITPTEEVPLLGYGDRTHRSTGVHDPLYASCWWLETASGGPVAWIVLDLCLIGISSTRLLAAAAAARVGLPPECLHISTTHTHSGPDVRALFTETADWAPRYRDLLIARVATALGRARERAVPSTVELRKAHCDFGVNRRDPSLPADTRLVLLSLVDEAGAAHAHLFHYSCHLTVLGADNYLVSADWLGPVRSTLRAELGVPVMFLQGAEGNIDPVSRGFLDMADPRQAAGSSFEELEKLAGTVTSSVRAAAAAPPFARLSGVASSTFSVDLPLRYGAMSSIEVQRRIGGWKRSLAEFLGTAEAEVPEDSSVNALVKQRCRELNASAEETRRRVAEQFAYVAFLTAYLSSDSSLSSDSGTMTLPATLLDFGGLVVLGVPAEPLVEIAFVWQARIREATALACGLFDGWVGYLPHSRNFAEPNADERYETVSTLFAPEAADRLLSAALEQVRAPQAHPRGDSL